MSYLSEERQSVAGLPRNFHHRNCRRNLLRVSFSFWVSSLVSGILDSNNPHKCRMRPFLRNRRRRLLDRIRTPYFPFWFLLLSDQSTMAIKHKNTKKNQVVNSFLRTRVRSPKMMSRIEIHVVSRMNVFCGFMPDLRSNRILL